MFEFVKAFGDFDDHGAYDPDGGIFQMFKKNFINDPKQNATKPKSSYFEIFCKSLACHD